jgi:hypothetical protein
MNSTYDPSSPIRREILPNERLLWQGLPVHGLRFSRGDILMIPFSLFWGGFVFFWEYGALKESGIDLLNLDQMSPTLTIFEFWGIPFCLIGLYMIFGRFFYEAWQRNRTFYAVTDHRIIILHGNRARSMPLNTLPMLEIIEGRNSKGSIYFGDSSLASAAGIRFGRRNTQPATPVFEGIDDVRRVYNLIQQAIKDMATRA